MCIRDRLADVTYEYSNTNAIDGLPHCITHATVTGMKNDETLDVYKRQV